MKKNMKSHSFRQLINVFFLICTTSAWALDGEREQLQYDQLMSANTATGPVANRFFMPYEAVTPAKHRFSGAMTIPEHRMQTEPGQIRPDRIRGMHTQLFPGVTLEFVSHGDYLVPVERNIIEPPGSNSFWHIHVAPGRVWSEPGDGGMSRASFPFFLTNLHENETYNGVATFMFDDSAVSELRYQLVQQLSPFLVETRFVAWGQQVVSYQPGEISSVQLIQDFEDELADRLVWHDWSILEDKYGAELFSGFQSGIDPRLVVSDGLVIDGEVYIHSMTTPYGNYPYPREMRHGVWSVTKTAAGLITLLRMAQKYGNEILDYKIRDYVNVTADHDGWKDVTFRHAMSMATGIGTGSENVNPNSSSDGYVESDRAAYIRWYFARATDEKLTELFKVPSHPWGPGEYMRYRDRDIFVAAAAMANLYREKEGDAADLWQMMLDEVYRPIGIHHLPKSRTWEKDRPPVPLLAWGVYLSVDDIAKISGLMQNGGKHQGVQLLSGQGLAEALYETPVRGLTTGGSNQYGPGSYHLTVWHEQFATQSGRTYTIPSMAGYGGNIIKLMPNGMTGFRMGNGGDKPVEQMIVIADRMRPFDTHRH